MTPTATHEAHRTPPPPITLRLGDIPEGSTAYVGVEALYIDRKWGCWLDPDAACLFGDPSPDGRPASMPVTRRAGGFAVKLRYASRRLGHAWDSGQADGRGMLPVVAVE